MDFTLISKQTEINNLLLDLQDTKVIGLDTETTGLNVFSVRFLLMQINVNNHIYVIDTVGCGKELVTYIVECIKNSNKTVIGHNIKFDLKIIKLATGILLLNVFDTMIAEGLINAGLGNPFYSLKELVYKYKSIDLEKDIRDEFIEATVVTYEMLTYSARDVLYLEDIYNTQLSILAEQKQLQVCDLEMKLVPVVTDMELTGIKIDLDKWDKLIAQFSEERVKVKQRLVDEIVKSNDWSKYNNALTALNTLTISHKETKAVLKDLGSITQTDFIVETFRKYFNPSSNQQMLCILNTIFNLKIKDTNEKTLNEFRHKYPVVQLILDFRDYDKKLSTYGEGFKQHIDPVTGKVHTQFNQTGTATGRFSSDSPNLQNIPRSNYYRNAFIADDGWVIINADYSQCELRLAGDITGEPKIIEAYQKELDLHTVTAADIYKVSFELVEKEQRQRAKNINFAQLYGSSPYGLSYNFGIPLTECFMLQNRHEEIYPIMHKAIDMFNDKVVEKMYSSTLLGRKRYFRKQSIFDNPEDYDRYIAKIKREGFNHIVQGTSADATKLAMVGIYYNNPFGDKLKIVLTVHDEIEVMVKDEIKDDAKKFVEGEMVKSLQRFLKNIPAVVESKTDTCWVH